MANSVASAKTYVENEQALQTLFRNYALTQDLAKPFVGKGNGTVSIETVTLSTTTAGTYSEATGLPEIDMTIAYVDKTPSKDKGNVIHIDRLADESALGNNIIKGFNRYGRLIMNPTMDKDNLSAICSESITSTTDATATDSTIQAEIDAGLDKLYNAGLSPESAVVLYISTTCARNLKNSLASVGGYKFGEWNNIVDKKVALYGDTIKAKVVEIPDTYMPSKTQFVLVPIDAVDFVVVNRESTLFDKVPGHGSRKLELDINFVYDCWVKPEAKALCYKSITA